MPQGSAPGARFWLWWLLATLAGTAVGMGLMFVVIAPVINRMPQVGPALYGGVVGAVIGGTVGTAQWALLRRHLQRIGSWVAVTAVAWVAFWVLEISGVWSRLLGANSGIAFVSDALHVGVLGFLVGAAQWMMLSRRRVRSPVWWIVASVGSVMLGAVVADAVNKAVGSDSPLDFFVGSITWALVMGVYLMRLLQGRILKPTAL